MQDSNKRVAIKFSKELEDVLPRTARLLLVTRITMDELRASKDFFEYVTRLEPKLGYCELYIILLFQKPDGGVFVTVRTYDNKIRMLKSKFEYYQELVGKDFDIFFI